MGAWAGHRPVQAHEAAAPASNRLDQAPGSHGQPALAQVNAIPRFSPRATHMHHTNAQTHIRTNAQTHKRTRTVKQDHESRSLPHTLAPTHATNFPLLSQNPFSRKRTCAQTNTNLVHSKPPPLHHHAPFSSQHAPNRPSRVSCPHCRPLDHASSTHHPIARTTCPDSRALPSAFFLLFSTQLLPFFHNTWHFPFFLSWQGRNLLFRSAGQAFPPRHHPPSLKGAPPYHLVLPAPPFFDV